MEDKKQSKAKLSNGQTAEELTARLPIPGPGRKPQTEQERVAKKAMKVLIEEYREKLSEALPEITPVLLGKAIKGDMAAIRELHEVIGSHAPKKSEVKADVKVTPILGGITNELHSDPSGPQNP